MPDTIIGSNKPEVIDPNMVNMKKPYVLFKDDKEAYYVQGGRIFNLAGYVVIDSNSSEQDIFILQQSAIGKMAVESAGVVTDVVKVENEKSNVEIFKCGFCDRKFKNKQGTILHETKIHGERSDR